MEHLVRWGRYLWRAFNARPWGMPIPPLWFGLAAAALLGYFIDPAFYMIGGGATLVMTGLIAGNRRFQQAVDAMNQPARPNDEAAMRNRLDEDGKERQAKLERQCAELQRVLESANAGEEHIRGVWQLADLHLRLMAARSAAEAVVASSDSGSGAPLPSQVKELRQRLSQPNIDKDLRKALEDQASIAEQRLAIQAEARRRLDVLDAELDRIREQLALIRDQALMTSDPTAIRRSVDALATFLSESGRWLKDQQEIFGELDIITPDPFGSGQSGSPSRQRAGKRAGELQ
ncbi:AAA family ATPase [Dongia deserti]|uniref:hypothetical protein n=1 Tax=Dongia deserti TaxID=2268030 RepID=UPI0013C461CC|nr:hypothetical protein [Dongia deserti]